MIAVTDTALINSFLNDPDIYAGCLFDEPIGEVDAAPWKDTPGYVFLVDGDDAMMMFHPSEPRFERIWQKHNLFRATCRGAKAITTGRRMLEWMKDNCGSTMIWAQTPIANRKARWFNRQIGMTSNGLGTSRLLGEVEFFVCRQ